MTFLVNPFGFAAGGPPAFVGGNKVENINGGGGSLSLTSLTGGLSSAPAAGDVIIVAAAYGIQSLRDASWPPSGFTSLADLVSDDSFDCRLKVAYKVATGSETSININGTANVTDAAGACVHVWRNISNSTPIDVTTTTATGIDAAQPDPPAITPTTAGAIIIVIGGAGGGTLAAFSGPSMTGGLAYLFDAWAADTQDGHCAMYAKTNWTSGAFNPVAFSGGGGAGTSAWCAATVVLRPA